MAVKKVKKKKRSLRGGGVGTKATKRPRHIEKTPPCRNRCPSGNRVREFVTKITEVTKYQILQQTSISMLAQANMNSQSVLALFR